MSTDVSRVTIEKKTDQLNFEDFLGSVTRVVTITGTLASGYAADGVLLEAPDWRYLAYHLGAHLVAKVILHGERAELG